MDQRVAMLCLHSSPLDTPGTGSSGGMNVYVRELSRSLAASGTAVDIFTRSQGAIQIHHDADGVRVIAVPVGPPGPLPKNAIADQAPALLHAIVEAAHGLRYDLVHSHYWVSGLVARHLAHRWNVPSVHMFHTLSRVKTRFAGSTPDERRARGEQRVLDTTDAIVVANEAERDQLRALYCVRQPRLAVIPCGIDPEPFGEESPQSHGSPVIVVALGRLERLKNFGLLLRALAVATRRDPAVAGQIEVHIAGGPAAEEPEERVLLERLATDLGIADRVRLLGAVPRESIPALYAASDICVVPSHYESFGLVAVEAMAAGLPVLATRVGGLQSTVRDGESGYLIPPDDVETMAERLLQLAASPERRAAMGACGAMLAQQYAWPRIAARVRDLYEVLLADGRRDEALLASPARYCRR